MRANPLETFFRPKSIALIGASDSENSIGQAVLSNLLAERTAFPGVIFPVNPKHSLLMGQICYPSVGAIGEPVDLAIVATPASAVPAIIRECAGAHIPSAIIISAGFREIGPEGAKLEEQVLAEARRGKIRIVGPNCLGIMNPHHGLNATFASSMARPGHICFLSQSGALCTAILDWSEQQLVGFSSFVSVGSMLDVGWGELISFFGEDPNTRSIVAYMESIDDARSFMSAAREAALSKPIIIIKPGRTDAGAKAAASHTGTLTGQDDVVDAAIRRCGALRVNSISELFSLAEALDKQPRPKGPNLTIVTNAGGPAVLAADALLGEGGTLTPLSPETVTELNGLLPAHWSHHNPVDILGDADADRYSKAVELTLKDPATHGLLVILSPQAVTAPSRVAQELVKQAGDNEKPIIATWMGGNSVEQGKAILERASIPAYAYPDDAARIFHSMWSYSANLTALYETPHPLDANIDSSARERVATELAQLRSTGRTLLNETESKWLLAQYKIPIVRTEVASTVKEAKELAVKMGFPVAVKLNSQTITHKKAVGGVRLHVRTEEEVADAFQQIDDSVRDAAGKGHFQGVSVQPMVDTNGYELILGSSVDLQFGPVILFGSGGQFVELYRDRSVALPPLNTTLARRMMERTKMFSALKGVSRKTLVNLDALEQLIVRFSYLVTDHPVIKEIDINPLLASSGDILALDARVVLYSRDVVALPKPAIRPYPIQYEWPWSFKDGAEIIIRSIRPEDEPLMVQFHTTLSEHSVYLRYLQFLGLEQRIAHNRLSRICFNDYDREIALVAELQMGDQPPKIVGVGRLTKTHFDSTGEVAVLIADDYHGRGLGIELCSRLVEVAREEGLSLITADTLVENSPMQHICQELGFKEETMGERQEMLHFSLTLS